MSAIEDYRKEKAKAEPAARSLPRNGSPFLRVLRASAVRFAFVAREEAALACEPLSPGKTSAAVRAVAAALVPWAGIEPRRRGDAEGTL